MTAQMSDIQQNIIQDKNTDKMMPFGGVELSWKIKTLFSFLS
jgi:hypothetical protein